MDTKIPSPKELDAQCPIVLDGWLDLGSSEHLAKDDDPALTKKWLKMLTEYDPPVLILDTLGRCWIQSEDQQRWHPYHIECGTRKYGIRVSQKAAN